MMFVSKAVPAPAPKNWLEHIAAFFGTVIGWMIRTFKTLFLGDHPWVERFWIILRSDHGRLFFATIALVVIAALLWVAKHWIVAILASLGSFWLAWNAYNVFSARPVALFPNQPSWGDMFSVIYRSPLGFIVTVVAAILGVIAYRGPLFRGLNDNPRGKLSRFIVGNKRVVDFLLNLLAGVGTWAAVMLIYMSIAVSQVT